ncbi:hypothetical protein [Ruegeria sp. HKCCD8929]|uniref:hypothetical protein n=1 Tax=Ruegeria sp. HKCCD8929 TaxID=2683006 RepID=UPI001C2C2AB6|nr:hypothetical protein [Ruegeria sp. HKCCD8929]
MIETFLVALIAAIVHSNCHLNPKAIYFTHAPGAQIMKIESLLAATCPILTGTGFVLLVLVGHWLFQSSLVSARVLIATEFLYLLAFALSLLVAAAAGFGGVREKSPVRTALAVASMLLGLCLVGIGFNRGAAILYAT